MRIGVFSGVAEVGREVGRSLSEVEGREAMTSSAPRRRAASRMALVSTTHVKLLPFSPPDAKPSGPLRR